jgi:hypothetical protein
VSWILANSDNPHEGFLLRVEAVLIVSVACAKKLYLLKHILNFVRSQTLFLYPLTTASQGGAEGCARVRSYRPKETDRRGGDGHKGRGTEDFLIHL